MRPKESHGRIPKSMRGERNQGITPMIYALPSWCKKLKGQLPGNVAKATKFHPVKRSESASASNIEIAASAYPSFPLEGRKPHLNHGGNSKGGSKLLPRGSRKKRLILMDCEVVCDSGLHERKSGKDHGVPRAERKRLTV